MTDSLAAGMILGFLLATAYGAAFHIIMGGPARQIILYVAAAWIGFAIGQLIGDWLDINVLNLGAIHLFAASLGAWIALLAARWLGVINTPDDAEN